MRPLLFGILFSSLLIFATGYGGHGRGSRKPSKDSIAYVKALKNEAELAKRDMVEETKLTTRDLIFPRRLDYSKCKDPKKVAMIDQEVAFAVTLLLEAATLDPNSYQFRLFFKPEYGKLIRWLFYEKAKLLHPKVGEPAIQVYCDEPEDCIGTGNDAFVFSEVNSLTVCDQWFKNKDTVSNAMECGDPREKFLDDYYIKGMTIAHEMFHIKSPEVWQIEDLAYEAEDCLMLANGTYTAEMDDGTYQHLEAVDVIRNADSYAYVAMGAYFSRKCGHEVDPFPLEAETYYR